MAAHLVGLGQVIVPVPGTPVSLSVPTTRVNPPSVHAVTIQALPDNTGRVFVGVVGLDRTTFDHVLVVLPIPTANAIPTYSISLAEGANAVDLRELRIDANVANEGVLVSVVVA